MYPVRVSVIVIAPSSVRRGDSLLGDDDRGDSRVEFDYHTAAAPHEVTSRSSSFTSRIVQNVVLVAVIVIGSYVVARNASVVLDNADH